jgi:hypothetical protein
MFFKAFYQFISSQESWGIKQYHFLGEENEIKVLVQSHVLVTDKTVVFYSPRTPFLLNILE